MVTPQVTSTYLTVLATIRQANNLAYQVPIADQVYTSAHLTISYQDRPI